MSVYLDHGATTPLRAQARMAWLEAQVAANPSSVHADGQRARRLLEDARDRVAAVAECDPIEVVFTSGGTESINLAVKGLWWSRTDDRRAIALPDGEHHATMESVDWLAEREGARIAPVPIDMDARIDPDAVATVLAAGDTAFLTALVANNEVGTVNDVERIAEVAAAGNVPLHLDAVSAAGHVPLAFRSWRGSAEGHSGLVALSVSGHKLGAPVGTGALVVSRYARLAALQHGGGQQRGLRAGTQDVAGATALAVALECAEAERQDLARRHAALRARLLKRLAAEPGIRLLGDPERRVHANVHLHLAGAQGESVLYLLDLAGVSASTGSACQAGVTEASHVVRAMGLGDEASRQVLRLTMGSDTTESDIDTAAGAILEAYRRVGPASRSRV